MPALPLLPPGVLFKGAFVAPIAPDGSDFGPLAAEAKALGFNAIQWIMFVDVIGFPGHETLPEFLQTLQGRLETLSALGMYALPIGTQRVGDWLAVTFADVVSNLTAAAQLCAKFPCFAGMACTDESAQTGNLTESKALYTPLKSALPTNTPVACSSYFITGSAEWMDVAAADGFNDFHLFNLNPGVPSGTNWNTFRAAYPNHEIAFNVGYGTSDGAFETNFAAQNIIGTNNVRWESIFTLKDFDATDWGLIDDADAPRTARVSAAQTAFGSNPLIPERRMFPGSPSINERLQWGYK